MKTVQINTYKFNELSKDAQQKAIENERNNEFRLTYGAWWDAEECAFIEKAEKRGYTNVKMYFSGFSSQGDGACFSGSVDIQKWLKAHKLSNKYRLLFNHSEEGSIKIVHNNRYYYATSTSVMEEFYNQTDKLMAQVDAVVELIEKEREELGNELYKDLEAQYNYLQSDDVIADYLTTNECDFLKDGSEPFQV